MMSYSKDCMFNKVEADIIRLRESNRRKRMEALERSYLEYKKRVKFNQTTKEESK